MSDMNMFHGKISDFDSFVWFHFTQKTEKF